MQSILDYLMRTYAPEAILLYGSFANGTNNAHSDFDALVIADAPEGHDASTVDGTVLDVWVYPPETFSGHFAPEDFVQIFDGKIVLDKYGTAEKVQQAVLSYLQQLPTPGEEENRQNLDWCQKMMSRTTRGDAEGYYRWHWLLTESLQIYCDIRHQHYFGPKKAMRWMQTAYPADFDCYQAALMQFGQESLTEWVACLTKAMEE